MKLLSDFSKYDSLFICGDIHGEFETLVCEIKYRGITNAVIILAGDCGIGFEQPAYYDQLYKHLAKTLQSVNCLLLLMRGNHDDPEYFQKKLIDFPYMKTLPDYSVVQFAGRNILCVGGGVSIDRSERLGAMRLAARKWKKKVVYYWENEMPVFDPNALAELTTNNIKIDTVVTHIAPSFCRPINKAGIEMWLYDDAKLNEDLDQERAVMDKIYDYLSQNEHQLPNWFYGHFHASHTEYISGTCFRMLNIMELCESRAHYINIEFKLF